MAASIGLGKSAALRHGIHRAQFDLCALPAAAAGPGPRRSEPCRLGRRCADRLPVALSGRLLAAGLQRLGSLLAARAATLAAADGARAAAGGPQFAAGCL